MGHAKIRFPKSFTSRVFTENFIIKNRVDFRFRWYQLVRARMLRYFSRQSVARYISTLKLVDKGLKKFKDSKNVSYFCNYCIIKIIIFRDSVFKQEVR